MDSFALTPKARPRLQEGQETRLNDVMEELGRGQVTLDQIVKASLLKSEPSVRNSVAWHLRGWVSCFENKFLHSAFMKLPENLHWVFLLYSMPLITILAIWTPPYQSPDELNHFFRAYQVAHGRFFGGSGGFVPVAVEQLYGYASTLPFHSNERYTSSEQAGAAKVQWTDTLKYEDFPNTQAYAPTGYIPQALAILLGQAMRASALRTLILARMLNGGVAITLCTISLFWCRGGKVVMFAVLLLPMTLSLFASASQDAALISCACLAFGMISRQIDAGTSLSVCQTLVVSVSLLVMALGRPPYAILVSALFIPGLLFRGQKIHSWVTGLVLSGSVIMVTLFWWAAYLFSTKSLAKPSSIYGVFDAKLQLINLLHHPAIFIQLCESATKQSAFILFSTIGILGWLDTVMPFSYYFAISLVLMVCCFAEMNRGLKFKKGLSALILTAAFFSAAGVFFIQYLIWSPVGSPVIYNLQGRYLIPSLIAASVGLPSSDDSQTIYRYSTVFVVLAQLLTMVQLPRAILARYYF